METPAPETVEKIVPRIIEEEMKQSYVDYAMSVIVGRALPDVRDGLKPVHRRILFAMNELGLQHNKPFRKCARIVGDVLGKFHPHGDVAVYDSLVRMAQDFSLRYTLVNGHGNFGSVDGDSPAAMRYTEAKLQKIAEELLQDIDKETVPFQDNFDGSLKEPAVLPSKIPNLLINGSSGIAVGMATNIPPHNLGETADAVVALLENPDISIESLMGFVKGPDFPTGGIICGTQGIKDAYTTGRGKVVVRAKAEIDEKENRVIITEIPFAVNKAELITQAAELVEEGKIKGISDIRDESDREGMRIIFELKRDSQPDVVLNQLYKHTRLQDTFGIGIVALVGNKPMLLTLRDLIFYFVEHRKDIIYKRTAFDLRKAEEKAHILEGLLTALRDIDATIRLIKESNTVEAAKVRLMRSLVISEKQAIAILDMKLQRLTALEQEEIAEEHKKLLETIQELKGILASPEKIRNIIKGELSQLKEEYGNDRKTAIIGEEAESLAMEDLIKQEQMVITISHAGYCKRQPLTAYKQQRRGGKGIIAQGTKELDFVEDLFIANTHAHVLFFTNKGRIHWLKVYEIPEGSRISLGKPVINLLQLQPGEVVSAFIPVDHFTDNEYLVMATKQGTVKKTRLSEYSNPRRGGIIAITLEESDELMSVVKTDGSKEIILATKNGLAVRFKETDVRETGRSAKGVKGATLKENDEIVAMVVATDDKALLTVTENGFGKRSPIQEYRLITRGGVGVINILCSERNGNVVAVKAVDESDELMFISKNGITIRTPVSGISVIGRATQGVRLMKLEPGDKVVAAAKIVGDEKSIENGKPGQAPGNPEEQKQPEPMP
ncbi:DNA gyrase subunit A [Candidatus Woesearchaeota archaeon]|nr:DNA gyrase subunit A [Candidatus Woesearchaeota archaeon]